MPQFLNPLRFTGATILRDGALQQRSLSVADGRITKGPLPEVNLQGYYILPGIIDLQADSAERHIAAPPGAGLPLETGLRTCDIEAAAHGVTTAWLTQGWSWEGGPRGPDHAEAVMAALERYRAEALTDLRLHLRCDPHLVDTGPRLLAAARRHRLTHVSFGNRLEEALTLHRDQPGMIAHWAQRVGTEPEALMALAHAARKRAGEVPRHLCRLAEAFDQMGVIYGSQGDPDGETRERFSMIGARLAACPATRKAAAAARAMNDPVLLSAADLLRGSAPAAGLIRQGLCDALVSGDSSAAQARAAWQLAEDGLLDLPRAWAMISDIPARIMRLPDRGRLDIGKRADICVVNAATGQIEMTIAGGRLSFLTGQAAHRFADRISPMKIAAE